MRARLRRGAEDTRINFLLFGVSFTKQPRVTSQVLAERQQAQTQEAFDKLLNARIGDLIKAFAAPKVPVNNDQLLSLRKLVIQQGYQPGDTKGRARLREYILANLQRTLREQESYTRTIAAARSGGNASEEFIERSKLYRERGLSLDTTLSPNFAIEESLKAMKSRGLIAAGSVRKEGVIGPGLDFTDKADGYHFSRTDNSAFRFDRFARAAGAGQDGRVAAHSFRPQSTGSRSPGAGVPASTTRPALYRATST